MKFSLLYNVVEELTTRHELHDHEDVGGRADNLIQLDDVRMSEELEILDFTSNLADHIETLDLLPIEDLDGDLVFRDNVLTDLDFSECSI